MARRIVIGSEMMWRKCRYAITGYMTVGDDIMLVWMRPTGGGKEIAINGKQLRLAESKRHVPDG